MTILILRLSVMATDKIEWDLTTGRKIHLLSTCCSFERKKKLQSFYHSSRHFPGLENSRFFQEFRTLYEPCIKEPEK